MATIAARVEEFFPVCPKDFKRSKSAECKRYATEMLDVYLDNNMISEAVYDAALNAIENAPHDDAISNIMTKVRKRAKW